MVKKKTHTSSDIIAAFMKHVLEHGERPKSVYAFASALDLQESEFYNHFGSFEAIE